MPTEITPQLIKELRERTGVGIGKCKEALEQAKGDIEEAIQQLRKAGIAGAVKKEGRSANEGMISTAETGDTVSFVELNAETDFVVKNQRFQDFAQAIATQVAKAPPKSLEDFLKQKFAKDPSVTVDEYRAGLVQAIGENIVVRRLKTLKKSPTKSVGVYSHLGGKIVTAVEIEGSGDVEMLAKEIAMHVAAAAPEYVNPEDVPAKILQQEKEVALSQLKGKPENVIQKIIDGKLSKFYDDVCLNRQLYIKNDKMKIADVIAQRAKEIGKPLKITGFVRWSVGQST